MQIYLNIACNFFLIIVFFGMGVIIYSCITSTAQSRKHDTICVLKLVLLWLLFSV